MCLAYVVKFEQNKILRLKFLDHFQIEMPHTFTHVCTLSNTTHGNSFEMLKFEPHQGKWDHKFYVVNVCVCMVCFSLNKMYMFTVKLNKNAKDQKINHLRIVLFYFFCHSIRINNCLFVRFKNYNNGNKR